MGGKRPAFLFTDTIQDFLQLFQIYLLPLQQGKASENGEHFAPCEIYRFVGKPVACCFIQRKHGFIRLGHRLIQKRFPMGLQTGGIFLQINFQFPDADPVIPHRMIPHSILPPQWQCGHFRTITLPILLFRIPLSGSAPGTATDRPP